MTGEAAVTARVTTEEHHDSALRVITLDDAAKLNAIGDELRAGLAREVAAAAADERCRAIVITGANDAFSAGGELASMPTDPDAIRRRIGTLHDIVRSLVESDKVIISAVDGVAFGSGLSLAAAADVVVAGENARFGCTFGRVGLVPDVGFMWTVPRRIGTRRTRLMVLQNEIVDVNTASDMGLVDVTCPPGEALTRSLDLAARIIRTPGVTVRHAKQMLGRTPSTLDEVLADELERQIQLLATEEFAAARRAFLSRGKG